MGNGEGPTSEVWEYLHSADLTMANLELPLTTADVPADKAITLRADPNIAPSLREKGIDVATVANNNVYVSGGSFTGNMVAGKGNVVGSVSVNPVGARS